MNYPNDYDTPAFPAGKSVAFTRTISIWISIVFFLIVCVCVFMLLARNSKTNYPFLISVDPFNNEWTVLAYPNKNFDEEVEQHQMFQEKLVRDFVTSWFTISKNQVTNEELWQNCAADADEDADDEDAEIQDKCARTEQYAPGNTKCAIYCNSSTEVFETFTTKVLPQYRILSGVGTESWRVGKMDVKRIDKKDKDNKYSISDSKWQVYLDVFSDTNGLLKILVFVEVGRELQDYPANLGYYIKDFNSYRITQ